MSPLTANPRRIAICNERFLVRFGVDRLLVRLGEHLVRQGHDVTFFCLRADMGLLGSITEKVEVLDGPTQETLLVFDAIIAKSVVPRLRYDGFDVCLIGGWPFFQTAAELSTSTIRGVFIDAGAVPHEGFQEPALSIQREVCRLREASLPRIDLVMPISAFIRETQTLPDRGTNSGTHLVLLGADHMDDAAATETTEGEAALLASLDDLRMDGFELILALGRMEAFGYKNSRAVFEILRATLEHGAKVKLLILTGPEAFDVPQDLDPHVIMISTVSDGGLQRIMEIARLGISPSLWEGFNLPVAEMQRVGRPALAFNIGAHPEVIADPWLLCETNREMASKALDIILDRGPEVSQALRNVASSRNRFVWQDTLERWTTLMLEKSPMANVDNCSQTRIVLADVSNSARDPANSGVIRVTRRLTAELADSSDLIVLFVKWDGNSGQYRLLSGPDHSFLSSNSGPTDWIGNLHETLDGTRSLDEVCGSLEPTGRPRPILLIPEVILDGTAADRLEWARSRGNAVAFIFYDMLPIFETRFVSSDVAASFPAYLAAMASSDAMFAISDFSRTEYERWSGTKSANRPARREAVWLPAQFSAAARMREYRAPRRDPIEILCVSTIEPRKNHAILVEAFRKLVADSDRPVRLNLVGNSYAGEYGLSDWVRTVCAEEPRIVWHGIVDDRTLQELYARSRFTIYPSLAEGFGMPIMESLWLGRPCICHSGGVMAELAAAGGCMTIDMRNADALVSGMARLLADDDLYARLSQEARERELMDWQTYGRSIAERLHSLDPR